MNIVASELLDALFPLLERASDLSGLHDAGSPEFPDRLRDWLVDAEAVLKKHKQPQIAAIAGLRAELGAAAEGVVDARAVRMPADGSARKVRRAVAALLLSRAQGILGGVHEVFAEKREEGAKYMRQMIMLSLQKKTFYPAWAGGADHSQSLNRVLQTLVADADTQVAARHVLALLSYPDALRLIDEVATEWRL